MSNLTYANDQKPLWLSSQGVDVVQLNHNTSPPLGLLNKDVLYALDDGKLYFNGSEVVTGAIPPGGDMVSDITPGAAQNDYLLASSGTTGFLVKETDVYSTNGNLTIPGLNKSLQMYDVNTMSVRPLLYSDSTSTVVGFNNTTNSDENVIVGQNNNVGNRMFSSIAVGNGILNSLAIDSSNNVAIGHYSLSALTDGSQNVSIGNISLPQLMVGSSNYAIGSGSGNNLVTGSGNLYIGDSNTLATESDTLRIGNTTTSKTYIQGLTSLPLSNKKMVVTNSTTGEIGYENPSHMAVAENYFENFASPYVRLLSINVPAEIAYTGTLISNMSMDFDVSVPGRLKWLGTDTLLCHAAFSFSANLATGVNENFAFYCAVNGVKVIGGEIRRRMTNSVTFEMITWHKVVTLATGQYLSCFATNLSGSNALNFGNCNQVIMSTH